MDDITNANPATPSATTGATTSDWEARFKGLQTTMNAKEGDWSVARTKAEATIAAMTQEGRELQKKVKDLEDQARSKDTQVTALVGERDGFKSDAATSGKKLSRFAAIAKHPALLEDERGGLLRTDLEGDDFGTYLENYAKRIGIAGQQAVQQTLAGSTPAGGSTRQPTPTRSALGAIMRDAQRKGDMTAYDAAYQQWLAAPK